MGTNSFTLKHADCIRCNPQRLVEEARRHAALPDWEGERPLKQNHVADLADRIAAGRAIPFIWATIRLAGQTFRENGHHSAEAIKLLEEQGRLPEQEYILFRSSFEAVSKDGVAELFWQYDSMLTVRSKVDIAGAYLGLTEALKGLPRGGAKLALDGIRWHEVNVTGVVMPSNEDLYQLFNVETYHPFIRWYATTSLPGVKPCNMKATVAAMYGQFQESEVSTREFWGAYLTGGSIALDAPGARLQDLYDAHNAKVASSSNAIRQGHKSRKASQVGDTLKPMQLYSFANLAWNAFVSGEKSLTALRLPSNGKPVHPLTVDVEGKFIPGDDAA